ncbi:MAG: MBL fold metallo-hydrolase [Parcubacteria group bacterium]|nr:MBL fold metallo-hydrolase [Parcubacteria group bacterium]
MKDATEGSSAAVNENSTQPDSLKLMPENIGFFIAGRLLHPGDCVAPSEEVHPEILALPVVAPWMAVHEALEFVQKVKPKFAIPVHDAMVKWPEMPWYKIFETGLEGSGIEFVPLKLGEVREF